MHIDKMRTENFPMHFLKFSLKGKPDKCVQPVDKCVQPVDKIPNENFLFK